MFALMIDAFILSFIKWVTYFNVSLQMGHLDIKYNYNCKFFCSLLLSFRCGVVLFLSIPTFLLKKIPFCFSCTAASWSTVEQLLACAVGPDWETAQNPWVLFLKN